VQQREGDRIFAALGVPVVEKGLDRKQHCLRAKRRSDEVRIRPGGEAMAFDVPTTEKNHKVESSFDRPPPPLAGRVVEIMRGNGSASSVAASRAVRSRRANGQRGVTVAPDAVTASRPISP